VSPRAATVVRLERALALGHGCRSPGARYSVLNCWVAAVRTAGGRSSPAGTGSTPSSGPTRRATRAGSRARARKNTRRWARLARA
jgi:hypothetical protein